MPATNTMDGLLYQSLGILDVDWKRVDGKIEVFSETTPFYKYVPLTTSQYSRDILLMKAAILDKALAVGMVAPDDMGMPISVYEGYDVSRNPPHINLRCKDDIGGMSIISQQGISRWNIIL